MIRTIQTAWDPVPFLLSHRMNKDAYGLRRWEAASIGWTPRSRDGLRLNDTILATPKRCAAIVYLPFLQIVWA